MKTTNIIYYCYGGAHSSVVTAAIHLGLLISERTPTTEELLQLPYYDRQEDVDHGKFRLLGQDRLGNKVYIVGVRKLNLYFEHFVKEFLVSHGVETTPLVVNTLTGVNFAMRLGGFISRKLGLTVIGRPIVIWGTKKAYKNFVKIAMNTIKLKE